VHTNGGQRHSFKVLSRAGHRTFRHTPSRARVVGGGRTRRAAALGSHEADCRDLNASTRLNPTLSLAVSMRRIAGRSLNWRTASWTRWSEQGAAAAAMAVGAGGG
jgi:hypothetical protein